MAQDLLHALINGLLDGGAYALMAVGLTLIFGVLDIINIAQGVLVVLGAYLSYVLSVHLHLDLFLGLLVTVPVMFVLGIVMERLFIRPLKGRDRVSMSLLASYAIAIIIEGALYLVFGPNYVQLTSSYVNSGFKVASFYVPWMGVYGLALAIVLVATLFWLLFRTKFGRSVRALMQDRTAALLVGINVSRVAMYAYGIGIAVTAVGGMIFGSSPIAGGFNPNTGYDLISRLLSVIILGGLGSIGGALIASFVMLTIEDLVVIWAPTWSQLVFYIALVLVLTFRPEGLFGKKAVRAQ